MKTLDLFSGIGGFALGLERAGFETIAFCEIEKFPCKVLAKHWPDIPIAGDIKQLNYSEGVLYDNGKEIYRGAIDAICGGYPCQPFSVAGKQRGADDERHLWPEYFRLIREIRPRWIIGENVAGHINMGLDNVLSDLESEGYGWEAFVVPACAINAPHRRDRIWIVGNSQHNGPLTPQIRGELEKTGYSDSKGQIKTGKSEGAGGPCCDENVANPEKHPGNGSESNKKTSRSLTGKPRNNGSKGGVVSNPDSRGLQGRTEKQIQGERDIQSELMRSCEGVGDLWAVEPRVCRVADGVPNRTHRLKGLGNAVVPQIPEIIGKAILKIEG